MNLAVQHAGVCEDVRASFSEYLDGAVSGHEMYAINAHLEECAPCKEEFTSLRQMQQALTSLRPARVPANMGLKLRVTISQLKARRDSRWTDRLAVRWENALRPLVLQASAGFAGTIVFIGGIMMLLGMVAAPQAVMAHDIPLGAMTAPHYRYSAASQRPIITGRDTTIVVEAAINSSGQVYDYKFISGSESPDVERQIAEQLMLSVFEPARVFGSPVRGRAIVTFAGISVHA